MNLPDRRSRVSARDSSDRIERAPGSPGIEERVILESISRLACQRTSTELGVAQVAGGTVLSHPVDMAPDLKSAVVNPEAFVPVRHGHSVASNAQKDLTESS